jgi:hypothetical protein
VVRQIKTRFPPSTTHLPSILSRSSCRVAAWCWSPAPPAPVSRRRKPR